MKLALTLMGLLVALSLVADSTPAVEAQPRARLDSVATDAMGPNVIIRGWWRATGNPESIRTTLAFGGSRTHDLPGTAVTDTFQVARPAAGATIGGEFCVQSHRANWQPSPLACSSWSYTETGVMPPPAIDSVRADTLALTVTAIDLKPDHTTVAVGGTIEFCPVIHFGDGAAALRQADQTQSCLVYLQGLPVPTAAQQVRAEAVCLSWTVGSGTFDTRHACDQVTSGS
jgi:hypothetical protein